VNIEKARRMLRWAPQVTLATGLARTAAWMRSTAFDEARDLASAKPA
jgi:nucleoside-diphosphate-sugar epimerase